jgi:hypothetical protein
MRLSPDTDSVLKARRACRSPKRLCGFAPETTRVVSLLFFLLCVFAGATTASDADEIETEHLFGFTTGTDVGTVGEREFEGSTTARLAKRSGNYSAASQMLSVEFVPLPNFRTEYSATFVAHDITGVGGLDNRRQLAVGGLSADFRYQFLDRANAPFGFALGAEPHWSRIEDVSGSPVREYGADLVAAFDKEIVPNRIVAAFNLLYQPEVSRSKTTGTWSQELTSGIAAAAMAQISPGIFFGLEGRYLRHYDGLGLNAFDGHAAFVGPTLYVKLSPRAWVAAAWSAQIAGHAIGTSGPLDLVHFERHQVRFLFGLNF